MPNQEFRQRPVHRDWSEVKCFSCGKSGHSVTRCPTFDIGFPFILPGWKAEKASTGYMMISPRRGMGRRQAENAKWSGGGGPTLGSVMLLDPTIPGEGGGRLGTPSLRTV